jgi:hypothetical protein
MRRIKRLGLTALVLSTVLIGSGVAWAQDSTEVEVEPEQTSDTMLNFGYDILHHFFGWNLSALDGVFDCSLEGPYTLTYGVPTDDGWIPVDNLEDDAGVVMFPDRPQDELGDGLEAAGAPTPYSGADGECGLGGGDVTGPNGQVNHGMFMKMFNRLYEGSGRGCVARYIAHSDLGKGEQQVGPEGDPNYQPIVGGETGQADFESVEASCEHGKKHSENVADEEDGTEVHGNGNPGHGGRPDHAGKPHDDQSNHPGKPENPGNSAHGSEK